MRVELHGVSKRHEIRGTGETLQVLERITLTLEEGAHCLVYGPSGSGKSTLLALIGGVAAPSAGTVLWDGRDIWSGGEPARLRGEKTGYAFQEPLFLPELTVAENLLLPAVLQRKPLPGGRAEALLGEFGLAEHFDLYPSALSGGEKRRLAVARALLTNPELVILDEPTSALDEAWGERLMDLVLKEVRASGATLVTASHDAALRKRGGRILRMAEGVAINES